MSLKQFTLPPDTRAVGDGNPPVDMNGLVDTVTAMGAGLNVLNATFSGGADPTGATDSYAAIQAALNAVPSGGGFIFIPPGTYKVSGGTLTPPVLQTYLVCIPGTVQINSYVTGDCIRMYGTATANSQPGGGILGRPVIDGTNAGSSSSGVHAGDMYHPQWDFAVQNFTGTGSIGAWFDNNYSWMEQATGRVFATNCTNGIVFDNSANTSGGATGSFDRTAMDLFVNNDGAGPGVTFQNGAFVEDGRLGIYGNFSVGAAAAAYPVLKLTGSNTPNGYSLIADSVLTIGVELAGQATTVASGSNGGEISTIASWGGTYGGNGVLDVASTSGFPSSGTIDVAASGSTTAVVTYTGVSGTSFTGCAYVSGSATGTVSTGGTVTLSSSNIPTTISFGSSGNNVIRRCTGVLDFGAHNAFAAAVNATNSMQFEGPINGDSSLRRTQGGTNAFNAGTGLASNGNIATVNDVITVSPTSALTGMIMPKWSSSLGVPTRVTVINRSSTYSITMATAGTSNVASGTSCVIAALTATTFWWDTFLGQWVAAA